MRTLLTSLGMFVSSVQIWLGREAQDPQVIKGLCPFLIRGGGETLYISPHAKTRSPWKPTTRV